MRQNCLGYALGIVNADSISEVHERTFELEKPDPVKCFLKKLHDLGFVAKEIPCSDFPQQKNQSIIACWGLFPYLDKCFGFTSYVYDFHVARRELDGSWTHKQGWDCPPEPITIDYLTETYGCTPYFFSIQKKVP